MIDRDALDALITTYEKHGWVLRRVLLSKGAKSTVDIERWSRVAAIVDSDLEAAWFSRPPEPGGVAWEIRYLGEMPYALVEKIDESTPEFEENLAAVESRLMDAISSKRKA